MPTRRPITLLVALAIVLAACSNSGGLELAETTTTVQAETTTTTTEPDQEETTTTSVPAVQLPTAPLTGVPTDADLDHPALLVKIDNHPRSRPQTGLDQADLVFEVRAEGVTRFAAVYHSTMPDPVGPVRSSRTSDFDLLRGFETPLYASSGGNDYVANGLRSLPIQAVTAISRTEYFRDGSRPAPHNLYVNTTDLFALADSTEPPLSWFDYREPDDELPSSAVEIQGPVTITYRGSPVVTHTWDATREGWLRTQDGRPHTNVTGDQLAPENVVIMVADYTVSPADAASPEVVSVGTGQLFVLTDGHVIQGTWDRVSAEAKPELVDTAGRAIALTPGRTWVLMPEAGNVTLPTS